MKIPFFIGQSSDDVLKVAEKTGRYRLAVEFATEEGETFRFDLAARNARERRERKEVMKAAVGDKTVDLARLPVVRYFYADCTLTFGKTRGPSGEGALCYRIIDIDVEVSE